MGEYLSQIPEEIQSHIRQITKTSGLPDAEESVEEIARAWLEKKQTFENKLDEFEMEEIDCFAVDELRGALLLTYSGSILTIGPTAEGVRNVEYVSVGLRQDVPETASNLESQLASDVMIDEAASFTSGPIQKSSAIHKIAVSSKDLTPDEESEMLADATQILAEEFVEINKTIISE